jgi:hypothetical protein
VLSPIPFSSLSGLSLTAFMIRDPIICDAVSTTTTTTKTGEGRCCAVQSDWQQEALEASCSKGVSDVPGQVRRFPAWQKQRKDLFSFVPSRSKG